ncbi:histidine kinase [Colwelliaceae bacterium 6471]
MFDRLFNSIVFRIGSMMFLLSFVSIFSMFSSVFISELADQDALVINDAGSLRKQSYKMLAELELLKKIDSEAKAQMQVKLQSSIETFNQKITAPVMQSNNSFLGDIPIKSTLIAIQNNWFNDIEPKFHALIKNPELLTSTQSLALNNIIDNFVVRLDGLVNLYQQRAENRILLIRMILGISLFITTILVAFTMFQISRKIEKPLSELTRSAKKIMSGDYTTTTKIQQNDELGLLADTMNKMTQALSYSYGELEQRVKNKTAALRQSNDSLELLYQTSQLINHADRTLDLRPIAIRLAEITNKSDIDLCLTTETSSLPYEHIITLEKESPERCQIGDCHDCLSNNGRDGTVQPMVMRYPIKKDDISYGVLVCNLDASTPLEAWQHQLFSSISTLIANGLHIKQQNEQSRRITLLDERNVIARELHDSLAQALSYLKIQVSRLQKLRAKEATEEKIEDVILELKTGLNSAYRQLRELLTTFRLKIDVEGLYHTFSDTIEQLNLRTSGTMNFELDYQIENLPLTPNEEIHLMQIAREATQNALNHSKAENVLVRAFADEDKNIHLTIEDDGVGLPNDTKKLNHYGLAIMKERSNNLSGDITLSNGDSGGVKVELIFRPSYVKKLATVA